MTATLTPAKLSRADAATMPKLSPAQRAKVRKLVASHSRLTFGALRPSDGSLTLEGLAHQHQGRFVAGTLALWPKVRGGAYWRMIPYRLHSDGRICGFEKGNCGDPACAALEAQGRPTPDQHKRTREAIAKAGGSPLIPTAGKAKQPATTPKAKQAKQGTQAKQTATRRQPARASTQPAAQPARAPKGKGKGSPKQPAAAR